MKINGLLSDYSPNNSEQIRPFDDDDYYGDITF